MLYLSYIIRNWYPPEPGAPLESILEPRMFDFDASDEEFFQEAIGSPISAFANEIGTPEIPSEIAHRLASALEDSPEEDIIFAECSPFQAAAVLALCDKWAELKASARERMA